MATTYIQLSAGDVLAALNAKAAPGWQVTTLVEADGANCVCFNHPRVEVSFTTSLPINDGEYSFSVEEYVFETNGEDYDDVHNVHTLEEALQRINERANAFMFPEEGTSK